MYSEDPLRQRERQVAVLIAIFGVPLLLGFGINLLNKRRGGEQQPTSMLVVTSGGKSAAGKRGDSVLSAPAVPRDQIGQRLLSAGAQMGGDVEVSLAWNTLSDLDIGLRDPSGEMIHASHTRSQTGGVQDVDANPTLLNAAGAQRADAGQPGGAENMLPVPEFLIDMDKKLPPEFAKLLEQSSSDGRAASKFTRRPVEHIYYSEAPKGAYTVYVQCYSWRERDPRPLPFSVQVRCRGKVMYEWSGAVGPESYTANGIPPLQACQFVIR